MFGRISRILPSSISTSAGEVADLAVERQHHAALDQDAALRLQVFQLGIATLRVDRPPQQRRRRTGAASAAPARKLRRDVAGARKLPPSSQQVHKQR